MVWSRFMFCWFDCGLILALSGLVVTVWIFNCGVLVTAGLSGWLEFGFVVWFAA